MSVMATDTGKGLHRRDWTLLFLSRTALGSTGPEVIDPIRIQKGLFLLSKRGPARDLYAFRPHYWGPFSSEVYHDLARLETEGLVESRPVPGQTWQIYRSTPRGEQRAAELAGLLEDRDTEWLAEDRDFVTSRSFVSLLRDIYAAYPEYADKSLLRT